MHPERAPAPTGPATGTDGLAWHDRGSPSGERVVLLHGFTQTSRCWAPFDDLLAVHHPLRLVDAPGHGASAHADASLPTAARLLGQAGSPHGEAGTYLGYSMGGRVALRLALDAPHLVRRLVLIGASPGIADAGERAARRAADDRLAHHLCVIGIDRFLEEWLAQPLFAGLAPERAHLAERHRNRAESLAASLRSLGTGAQEPLWHRLPALAVPVLLVVGAHDAKFRTLAADMASAIGDNAAVAVIEGAGHTAHLEQPERTAAAVCDWLATS